MGNSAIQLMSAFGRSFHEARSATATPTESDSAIQKLQLLDDHDKKLSEALRALASQPEYKAHRHPAPVWKPGEEKPENMCASKDADTQVRGGALSTPRPAAPSFRLSVRHALSVGKHEDLTRSIFR